MDAEERLLERIRTIADAAATYDGHAGASFLGMPSLKPYEVPVSLQPTVDRLGLQPNIDEMREKGYTVLRGVAPPADIEALNTAVLRCGREGAKAGVASTLDLFGQDPCFDGVALNEKMCALAEVMCGQGFLLSQMVASIIPRAAAGAGAAYTLHADQNWLPAPFPEHNQLLTCCWTLNDDYTAERGATRVVPYSHKLRRHPTAAETALQAELAVPVECKRGEVVCWDGSVWHANGVRTVPGKRAVIHTTFSRLSLAPLFDYGKHGNIASVLARHTGGELQRLRSMLALEPRHQFFHKDPTFVSHHPECFSGNHFLEIVALSRGQHGRPTVGRSAPATPREALDALGAHVRARL